MPLYYKALSTRKNIEMKKSLQFLGNQFCGSFHNHSLAVNFGDLIYYWLLCEREMTIYPRPDNNRGLLPFFGRASVLNRQYTRWTLSVSVLNSQT